MPLISWIVPYYDLEPWLLERCLNSIVAQPCAADFEIIVVDDGSTRYDAMATVARVMAAPTTPKGCDIRLIRQANGGLSAARNAGMEVAVGEYLGFVDSDDAVSATLLPAVVELLREERPELIVYEACKFDTRALPREAVRPSTPTEAQLNAAPGIDQIPWDDITCYESAAEMMATRNLAGAAWQNLVRRTLMMRLGLRYPVGVFHEDGPLTTRLYYHAGRTLYVAAPVYLYYQRPGSIMHVTTKAHVEKRLDDFCAYLSGVQAFANEQASTSSPIQRRALERKARLLAGDYLRYMLRLYYPLRRIMARMEALRPMGLYPLLPADRGLKYWGLAWLGNRQWGVCLLYAAEAVMKRFTKI